MLVHSISISCWNSQGALTPNGIPMKSTLSFITNGLQYDTSMILYAVRSSFKSDMIPTVHCMTSKSLLVLLWCAWPCGGRVGRIIKERVDYSGCHTNTGVWVKEVREYASTRVRVVYSYCTYVQYARKVCGPLIKAGPPHSFLSYISCSFQ